MGMTNLQLCLAVGLPTIAVLASMIVSLVQISGIRDVMRELRREVNSKIDLLTGKVCVMMAEQQAVQRYCSTLNSALTVVVLPASTPS